MGRLDGDRGGTKDIEGMRCEIALLESRLKKPNMVFGANELSTRLLDVLYELGLTFKEADELESAVFPFLRGIELIEDPPHWLVIRETKRWKWRVDFYSTLSDVYVSLGRHTDARVGLTSAVSGCLKQSADMKKRGKSNEEVAKPASNALFLLNKKSHVRGARPSSASRDGQMKLTASRYTLHSAPPATRTETKPLTPTIPRIPKSPESAFVHRAPRKILSPHSPPGSPPPQFRSPLAEKQNSTFTSMNTAAVVIQSFWRMVQADSIAKHRKSHYVKYRKELLNWEHQKIAQHLSELAKQRKKPKSIPARKGKAQAAKKIQSTWRMFLAIRLVSQMRVCYYHRLSTAHRKELAQIRRNKEEEAATRIQKGMRKALNTKRNSGDESAAAIVIQKAIRRCLATKIKKERLSDYYQHITSLHNTNAIQNAIKIQSTYRRYVAEKKLRMRIQQYNSYITKSHGTSRESNVVKIQSQIRRYLGVKKYKVRLSQYHNHISVLHNRNDHMRDKAAITIQKFARRLRARNTYLHRLSKYGQHIMKLHSTSCIRGRSAVVIQKYVRMMITRRKFEERLQQYRSYIKTLHVDLRSNAAAIVIQSLARQTAAKSIVQNRLRQYREHIASLHGGQLWQSAIVIQCQFRRCLALNEKNSRLHKYQQYVSNLHSKSTFGYQSAVKIQSQIRRYLAIKLKSNRLSQHREYVAKLHATSLTGDLRNHSAVKIQCQARRYLAVKVTNKRRSEYAAHISKLHSNSTSSSASEQAAVRIQSQIRRYLSAKLVAVRLVQYQKYISSLYDEPNNQRVNAAIRIQTFARRFLAMKALSSRLCNYKQHINKIHSSCDDDLKVISAIKIQTLVRRYSARNIITKRKEDYRQHLIILHNSNSDDTQVSAVKIQSCARRYLAVRYKEARLVEYKNHIIKLHSNTTSDVIQSAAITIQRVLKGSMVRLATKRRHEMYRNYISELHSSPPLQTTSTNSQLERAALIIQRTMCGWFSRVAAKKRKKQYSEYISQLHSLQQKDLTVGLVTSIPKQDYRQDQKTFLAAVIIQKYWRMFLAVKERNRRRVGYEKHVANMFEWEVANITKSTSRINVKNVLTEYSEQWETNLWNRLQSGDIKLKQYLSLVRKVVPADDEDVEIQNQVAVTRLHRKHHSAAYQKTSPTSSTVKCKVIDNVIATTPTQKSKKVLHLTNIDNISCAVPPSWKPVGGAPTSITSEVIWDQKTRPANLSISTDLRTIWKTSHRDCVAISQYPLRSPSFKVRWVVSRSSPDSFSEALVGVIPYGEPGKRFGVLYRASDGTLKKQGTLKNIGRTSKSSPGDVLELAVDYNEGLKLFKNDCLMFSMSAEGCERHGYGKITGNFLVCAVLSGIPDCRVTLLPVLSDEAVAAARTIQKNWKRQKAIEFKSSLCGIYKTYVKNLHSWEATKLADGTPASAISVASV